MYGNLDNNNQQESTNYEHSFKSILYILLSNTRWRNRSRENKFIIEVYSI